MNKNGIVRESPIGVQVQTKIHLGRAADERLKIMFQLAALKDLNSVLRQLLEFSVFLLTQIKACQLVIPGMVRKVSHRAAVNLFLLDAEAVLVQENGQPLV